MMAIIPEITVPTENDLKPLYDTAKAYANASDESHRRWNEVKMATGGNAMAAYRDAEYKRLANKRETLYRKAEIPLATINARFPWLDLRHPALWVGLHGRKRLPGYREYVRDHTRDRVVRQWSRANQDELEALRAKTKAFPFATTAEPGMILFDQKESNIYRIQKITHKGKRIVLTPTLGGDLVCIRPRDLVRFRIIDEACFSEIMAVHESHLACIERYCGSPS